MKKKFLLALLCGVMAVLCAVGFVACGGKGNNTVVKPDDPSDPSQTVIPDAPDHVHSFKEGWEKDGVYHWHDSACDHDVVSGKTLHEWDAGTVNVAASCKAAGETLYACKICGATKTEVIPKTNHDWEESDVAATCLAAGYHTRTCKTCKTTERSDYVAALGHDFSEATCTEAAKCSRCKEVGAPALGHEYAVSATAEATCTEGAKITYTCTHKGCSEHYESISGEPTGHEIEWEDKIEYVHTAGVCYTIQHIGTCMHCDHVETGAKETVSEHIFTGVSITEKATCAHDGEKVSVCSTCTYEKTETYHDADAHSWDDGVTNGNVTTFTCSNDSTHTRKSVVIEGNSATVDAADFQSAGAVQLGNTSIELDEKAMGVLNGKSNVEVAADTLGGDELQSVLGSLGKEDEFLKNGTVYNFTMTADDAPISNFNGKVTVRIPYELAEGEDPDGITVWYVNGDRAEEVQARYSDGFAVFETEHFSYYTVTRMTAAERCAKYGHEIKVINQSPTCLVSGFKMTVCTRCGENTRENLPATGHDWAHTAKAADCTHDGSTVYTCGNCQASYEVKIPATGHKWDLVSQIKATCEQAGKSGYSCAHCNEKYEISEPQKAHSFKNTVTAPTCVEGGYTTSECVSCGFVSVHSEVKALGHEVTVKTDAPTCVDEGLKYEYCARCESVLKVLEKTPAAGHKLTNGICTVCGEGCKHNYVAGTPVQATCTEKGYTPYTCTVCKVSYKGNVTPALGHDFGVSECNRCHAANPAAFDYYVNLANSFQKLDFAVKFTDFSVKQVNINADGSESKTTIGYEQLDVIEAYVRIEADGTLVGGGRADLRFIDGEKTFTVGVELVIYNETLYVVFDDSGATGIDAIKLDVEYMFREMSAGSFGYDDFREMYLFAQNEVFSLLGGVLDANAETLASAFGAIINNLFITTPTEDGFKYTLNLLLLSALNDKVYELKGGELFDYLFGKGSFDQLEAGVNALLDKTIVEAIDGFKAHGLDKKAVFDVADTFVKSFGDMLGLPADFDLESYYNAMIAEIDGNETTVAQLIAMAVGAGGGSGENTPVPDDYPDVPETKPVTLAAENEGVTADTVKETVKTVFEMVKNSTVYEIVAETIGAGAEEEIDKEELYEQAKQVIKQYTDLIDGLIRFEFVTDKEGFLTGATVEANEIPVAGGSTSRYDYEVVLSGKATFVVGGEIELDAAKIAETVNKLVPVLEKSSIVEAYSNVTRSNKTEYGIYSSEVGSEMRLHTDANGNIIKIAVTTERVHRYTDRPSDNYSKYFYYSEQRDSSIREYSLLQGTGVQITKSYCGDWAHYSYLGYCTGTTSNTYVYVQAYLNAAGEPVIVRANEGEGKVYRENGYYRSVDFYYNAKTGEYALESPHKFVLDEKKSNHVCEGFDLYVCENCGAENKHYLGHLGEMEESYKLADGATSCEEGVVVTYTCSVCHKSDSQKYDHYWHELVNETVYDLADYGSVCGGNITVHSCPCGEESYIDTNFDCDLNRDWLPYENTDSVEWYDHFIGSCVVTDPVCNFAFEYKYYIEYDEECRGVEHYVYLFGTMTEGEFVPSGKKLEFTNDRDVRHNLSSVVTNEKYDNDGHRISWDEENVCRRCGQLFGTTHEERSYLTVGELGTYFIQREYTLRVDKDGEQSWTERTFDYSDGEYCSPVITFRTSYGEERTQKVHHYNSGYYTTVIEPTCSQSGLEECRYCGDTELVRPHGHSDFFDSDKGVYVCSECGLEGQNRLDGSIVYEDMSTGDEYTVGYWVRDAYYWADKESDLTVQDLFMVRVAIVPVSELEGDGKDVTESLTTLTIGEMDRIGSGVITFSVAEILALVADDATLAEGFMVRVTLVPLHSMITGNDYAITLDAQGV